MPELTLYHFPGSCSQVTVCALEQAGLDYKLELVNLAAGEQNAPEYLAISPLGKAPALLVDGEALTENAALLVYVAALAPQAGLFPGNPDPRMASDIQAGLSFCGGTLHPQVRGLANPQRLTNGDGAPVREKSIELCLKSFAFAEHRLVSKGWWLGMESIIDVYLNWAFTVARNNGLNVAAFPQLVKLRDRLAARPAFVRMLAIDAAARLKLGLN